MSQVASTRFDSKKVWSIRLLSGHALTCQSPAKWALANTNNYTKKVRAPSTNPYQYRYMCVVWG